MQWTIEAQIIPQEYGVSGNDGVEQLIEVTRGYIDQHFDELKDNGPTLNAIYNARDAALFTVNRGSARPFNLMITGEDDSEFAIHVVFQELGATMGNRRQQGQGTRQQQGQGGKVDAGGGKR